MGRLMMAAKSGDKRATLVATRDLLAYNIETCDSKRDLAALTKRLMEVCAAIDALPDPEESNPVDEMAALVREFDGDDG